MTIDPDFAGRAVPFSWVSRGARWRGLRDVRVDAAALARVLAAHRADEGDPEAAARTILKRDERSCVCVVTIPGLSAAVKEVRKGGTRRRLADLVRGAPAMRAFRAGRVLIDRRIGAALPYAALEERVGGLPVRSLLVSADLRAVPTAAALLAQQADAAARTLALDALTALLLALHRAGVVHGDLRAQHVHVVASAGGVAPPRARLIDLEGVRFHRRLGDDRRIEDLVQLNASIPDRDASPTERREVFDRYVRALPFRDSNERVTGRIVRDSRARGHLFLGLDCES